VGRMRSGSSERGVSIEQPPLMTFTLRVYELAASAGADNGVTPSSRRLFFQSTKRTKLGEEVGPEDGLCDVGHHESPRELPA
jgi:hypothetical protein